VPRWPFLRTRLEPQAAYTLWAPTYPPHAHNPLMTLEQETVLALLPDLAGRTVVDAGCGSGRYLRQLRALGATPIGVDLSEAMLARAHQETRRIVRADLCALPIGSASADAVVCGLALGDVPHVEMALAEMCRVLRPGGCVVYSVVHPIGAREGWVRTFDHDGGQAAIDGYWHSASDHRDACAAAGLRITAWLEPVLAEAPRHPAVLVVRAVKEA
jgi:malonyl-CoA O-methyltransferase